MSDTPETMEVGDELVKLAQSAIDAALAYEAATGGNRKLGITAEVGELLACHALGLRLALDPRCKGYDALDGGLRVQIKSRRSESPGMPKDAGRVGTFSEHGFDYALLVLLDHDYKLCEVWRADYAECWPVIAKEKRRNPNLATFKRVSRQVFPRAEGAADSDRSRRQGSVHEQYSRYYPAEESFTRSPAWWFDVPLARLRRESESRTRFRCKSQDGGTAGILEVGNSFLLDNLESLCVMTQKGREFVRLHLSARESDKYQDLRGSGKVDLAEFEQ